MQQFNEHSLSSHSLQEAGTCKRKLYTSFSEEERAAIGHYATEHSKAAAVAVDGGNGSKYIDGTPSQGLLVTPPPFLPVIHYLIHVLSIIVLD